MGLFVQTGQTALILFSIKRFYEGVNSGVDYLSKLMRAEQAKEAEQQFLQFDGGKTVNGFGYHLSLPWKLKSYKAPKLKKEPKK